MKKYHKIQSVFKRDPENNYKTFLVGQYSRPEFEYLKDNDWVFTEKIDGTNIRIMLNEVGQYKIGGRTENSQIPVYLYDRLNELVQQRLPKMNDILKPQDGGVCLYGEGYGAKIQKGGGNYKSDGQDFVLFDISVGNWWLKREDVEDIADQLDIDIVPIVCVGKLSEGIEKVREGLNSAWGEFEAEGLVGKPRVELKDRAGRRIITKIKCKDFQR